ncbi:PAS domain S-box protein [Methanosarcina sp.]|uniref:PAS domain S-box protein n=1 Tax=Methanosarcina sp. TaxID=2213 RepID=UPI002988C130|nr:PAS domain S-box protein [Methanosarcina sp.]MDW5549885.1 PAS domain S-box protein [Methanosarcina sp.]MDW5552489.1 PAS domain S-box protein [Methanosarcina sp.]MDW5560219.1 PAS domain S-box protein [Methanosarcina sp.]
MRKRNRISGINIIEDVPWGIHFCQFCQTKEDLIDITVPYFKAGLENNEFCLWIVSELIDEDEAKEALKVNIPNIDAYLQNGQIEIISYTYWRIEENALDPQTISNYLIEKTGKALASGYDGLRYSGNDFMSHEKLLDSVIGKYPIMALCTYPVDRCGAVEILDLIVNHRFTLTKKEGKWEKIESSGNNTNNCWQTEKILQESEDRYKAVFDSSLDGIFITIPDGTILAANPAACQMFGMTEKELIQAGRNGTVGASNPELKYFLEERARTGRFKGELDHKRKDGTTFPGEISSSFFKDKNGLTKGVLIIRDVTKRKEAEAKLKETLDNLDKLVKERTAELQKAYDSLKKSERNLAEAQEMAHIGSWERDFATNELHWSDETYRIFGLRPQESKVDYNTFLSYVRPEDRDLIESAVKEALKGKPFDIYYRIITANGEERIVHEKAEVVFEERKNPARIIGTVQDITEHRKAEEKIQNLANVVESSAEAIITESFDGIITSWNKGAEQVYGYSVKEVIGKSILILEPPTLTGEIEKLCKIVQQGEKIRQYETLRLRKDGKLINVSLTIFPVLDNQGKITAVSVIATDITGRKEAEEKLRESEEKYRNIVETSNEGIYLVDNEAKITYANKIMETSGYTLEEMIGRPIWDFISEESKPVAKRSFEKRRKGIDDSYELKLVRKDGSFIWGLISAKSLFNKEGKFIGYLGMLTDITERKKAEEFLANLETARKKEIHHRIKNNLQVISSLLDLQAEQFKNRECIGNSEVLEAFRESQDRVISMALIHEELYRGKELDKLNFSPYIEELTSTLFQTYRLGNTNISLSMDLEENLFFDIDTAVPLGIIVNELVSNSLKHAFLDRERGEIRIKLHREKTTELEIENCESTSTSFILTISDNGIGIPENLNIEDLDSLGMQLVTSLVDQLDGELELKRDGGTEFTIRFG